MANCRRARDVASLKSAMDFHRKPYTKLSAVMKIISKPEDREEASRRWNVERVEKMSGDRATGTLEDERWMSPLGAPRMNNLIELIRLSIESE